MSAVNEPRRAPPTGAPVPTPPAGDARIPRVDSRELLRGHNELEIDHAGHIYRLRRTSLGKLILTK